MNNSILKKTQAMRTFHKLRNLVLIIGSILLSIAILEGNTTIIINTFVLGVFTLGLTQFFFKISRRSLLKSLHTPKD